MLPASIGYLYRTGMISDAATSIQMCDSFPVLFVLPLMQTDLANDDVMILDNGSTVFVWIGGQASDVESKLGAKGAQVKNKIKK